MSSCCQDTCLYPHNPEYGKCHKSGCSCGCIGCNNTEEVELETSIVRQKLLRSDYV